MESLGACCSPCSSCCCSSRSSCRGASRSRQAQEQQQLQSSLEPGDVVTTTSGLRGTVVDASYEDTVDLEIADGVVTTWVRAAIRERIARRVRAGRPRRRAAAVADSRRASGRTAPRPTTTWAPAGAGRRDDGDGRDTADDANGTSRSLSQPARGDDRGDTQEERPVATTPGRIRPWRYLAAFAGIVVVLYALVFFTGDGKATPKLGIDLQGGTRVTLTARTESRWRARRATSSCRPSDHRAAGQRAGRERRRGRPRRQQHHDHRAGRARATRPGRSGRRRSCGSAPVVGGPVAAMPRPRRPSPRRAPTRPPRHDARTRTAPTGTPLPDAAGRRGDPGRQPVTPAVALAQPLARPTPPRPRRPRATPAPARPRRPTPGRPRRVAAEIDAARATGRAPTRPRRPRSPAGRSTAQATDPLRGYDDPTLPLVTLQPGRHRRSTCSARRFLEGTQISTRAGRRRTARAPATSST